MVILLLEDQALVRAGMRALLQISEPHAVIHEASNYEDAVGKLQNEKIDIAFLDVDLKQNRSGLDLLRFMRSQELATRAIMLSGRAEKRLVMECIEAGASGYILKDLETDGVFRRALDTILQGNIFLPRSVIGRGGFSPDPATPTNISAESMGVTGRSLEVLYYLCQGLPNKTIAKRMDIEESTVRKDYVTKLFRLFGVARRTELIVEVSRRGISIPAPAISLSGKSH